MKDFLCALIKIDQKVNPLIAEKMNAIHIAEKPVHRLLRVHSKNLVTIA